ncbi:PREDICTED: probable disease resistance protein RPP1 isoform X2 [Prunus mume]|uniref:ADP-ribosyl cyclase/cyclic ADP-ribose hydrolase n=1 Tax=Prunus mume TaxID=102107 RepID=A0ABM1LTM0_PRUMU|nr:PREDICTED: probable disease resistance protein RPP1 isoform X2 [Prunus mume]
MDSSSSSSSSLPFPAPLREKYDVFLSFRGEDTRATFTSHLHKALLGKNIDTYIDRRLERGDEIAPALLKAIERSKIALVIFSKDYASSTWCLKELVHILGCKKSYGQIVIPIFYRIDPSDVRKQQGTYALEDRPRKRSRDEVANWRAALEEAANISGFHDSSKTGTEADFVEEVVQDVLTKLNSQSLGDLKGLVGIQRKIEEIESLLCLDSPGVCCVGIWGMGGIGKTTLADAVFHKLSSKFDAACFLANVREKSEKTDGLHQLRNKLVGEILKDKDVNIDTPSIPPYIQDRLRRTKALIVLDDVNARKQLEYLVGDDDRFCQGSRIIITARDKGLLEQKVDPEKIYNVEGLCSDEALKLFHSHAFGIKSPTTDYIGLSKKVIVYSKGNPLALKVMGSSFHRCKSKREWEVQWKKVKRVPIGEIQEVLRVSYDGLDDNAKEIFLDIACFHKGRMRNDVERMLDSCDFFGETGINDLIDRSLISISFNSYDKECIEMHDLVEEMGKAIAQGSRLLMTKDVNQLLANNQSDGHVQAISIDGLLEMEYANFEKMRELRLLSVFSFEDLATSLIGSLGLPNSLRYLDWYRYPLKSLPSKFSAQNLVVLEMPGSQVVGQLWNEDQSPVNLKWICLNACKDLTEVPNLSRSLKIEHIEMNDCQSLVEIPSYFQHLGKLTYLDLGGCTNLKILPKMPCNLEVLLLSDTAIEELPSSVWSHEKISRLDITSCEHLKSLPSNTCKLKLSLSLEGCESLFEFWELPRDTTELALTYSTIKELRINASIEYAVGLTAIKLNYCESLVSLPTNIWKLKSLKSLDLQDCFNFQNFPEISEVMEYLEFLNLSGTAVKELPPSIRNLVALRELNLKCCDNLESLPELPPSLKAINLQDCSNFQNFPEISEVMEYLEFLNLSGTAVKELPPSIRNLVALRKLDLKHCKNLEVVPDELFCLTSLQVLNMWGTEIKSLPASIKQAAQLSRLFLTNCKSLESLLELPPLLQHLEVVGCTSLKTVSSSSTALAQGWEKYKFSPGLHEKHIFLECPELDENARSNIMADAQLRIMRMATASSKFKEDKIEKASYNSNKESSVGIRCHGNEIPKWFSHKSEGCSIKIELPRDWFSTDFLGFALSLVVVGDTSYMHIGCKYNFKTSNGESHEVNHPRLNPVRIGSSEDSPEVLVWWYSSVFEEVVEGAQSPTAFYKLVTEVNVHFTVEGYWQPYPKAEKCGICLLYGKDAEMIKQRALYAQDDEIQNFF